MSDEQNPVVVRWLNESEHTITLESALELAYSNVTTDNLYTVLATVLHELDKRGENPAPVRRLYPLYDAVIGKSYRVYRTESQTWLKRLN
jgi:hypothetical protein